MAEPESSARGEKRYLQQSTPANAANKRRAPYTLRACDACRKRKGRCDGSKPCEYCNGRSVECRYSYPGDDRRSEDDVIPAGPRRASGVDGADSNSLSELVLSMQGQLAALSAQVQASVETRAVHFGQPASGVDAQQGPREDSRYLATTDTPVMEPPVANTARRAVKRFVGPTSADYSFNVAESKAAQGKHARRDSSQSKLPSIEEDHSEEEGDLPPEHISTPGSMLSHSTQLTSTGLFHFRTLLDQREAIRLVHVYGDLVHQMHPIYSIERLVYDIENAYSWPRSEPRRTSSSGATAPPTDDLSILIINMVLCIALCAESVSQSAHAKAIFAACEPLVNAKALSACVGVKQVTLALLVGFYHYFMGRLPLAWRMCGIAGRQAMEMGLHNVDASQQYPDEDQSHAEVVAISCTLIILDRNWSAASGLPPNFQVTDFELATKSSVDTPYLKAMMAFTIISHKFNEPISRAARGEMLEDDDDFDVLNFQVEQWRKRAVEDHQFIHPDRWETMPSKRPPAWTILLYLRGNAVKAILLRPFFVTPVISAAGKRSIKPALDVVTDSINTITILEETTDIYRKQHPFFQHFLSVSCALLSLLVTYVQQHRNSLAADLPNTFPESVKDNYFKALRLSAAYSGSFAASRRLWRRLVTMRGSLCDLGILSRDDSSAEVPQPYSNAQMHIPVMPSNRAVEVADWTQTKQNLLPIYDMDDVHDMAPFDLFCATNSGGGDLNVDFFAAGNPTSMAGMQPYRFP